MSKEVFGTIFNIQRFSIHDGPGIRTVVFEKGCPLRCKWCSNPESQLTEIQLAWSREQCIRCRCCENSDSKCGFCLEEDELKWNRFAVEELGTVNKICPTEALHTIGYRTSVEEVLSKVDRDDVFYSSLDGGMTISGGEPLMQPEFTYELLCTARKEGIHTAIETTGYARYSIFEKIAGQLDYLIMDIKHIDEEQHMKYTGVSNRLILDNFIRIRKVYPKLPILVRTPVIPGFNDSAESIGAIRDFIGVYDKVKYELLKYHRLGETKYASLKQEYEMGDVSLRENVFKELKKAYEFDNINFSYTWEDGGGI